MHTDDTNDVIAFALVQDMSRIIQLKPCCFEVVRLDIRISDLRRPQCDPDLASRIQGQSRERAVRNSTYMKPMLERIETLAGRSDVRGRCQMSTKENNGASCGSKSNSRRPGPLLRDDFPPSSPES
jgi:hypothetical protein